VFEITGLEGNEILADLKDLVNTKCHIRPFPPEQEFNEFFLRSAHGQGFGPTQ